MSTQTVENKYFGSKKRLNKLGEAGAYLQAYLEQNGHTATGKREIAALQDLGILPPGDYRNGVPKDVYSYFSRNPSLIEQVFRKIGLNSEQAKQDLRSKEILPASGITAEMRQKGLDAGRTSMDIYREKNPLPVREPQTSLGTQNTQQIQGFSLAGNNLRIGSSGDDVKSLQTYLKGLGIYQGKVDGIFGPQTDAAVKSFQSSKGLTADGIVGPKTASAINSVQTGAMPSANTQAAIGNTGATQAFNTGDPEQDALLQEISDFMKAQLEQGLKINPDLTFDSKTLDKFLETAKKQIKPYFAQQIDTIKQDVLRTAPQILQEYGDTIKDREVGFQNNLDTSRENFAGSGLAFSGQRAKGEFGMQDAQNRDLSSLSTAYGNKLYDLGRTAESKIGQENMSGFKLPSLSSYSTSLSGSGGFNQGAPLSSYQPGGYKIGSIQNDEAAAIEARRQALISTASENIRNGRSYQDLFK